jgi:hypothetical protein
MTPMNHTLKRYFILWNANWITLWDFHCSSLDTQIILNWCRGLLLKKTVLVQFTLKKVYLARTKHKTLKLGNVRTINCLKLDPKLKVHSCDQNTKYAISTQIMRLWSITNYSFSVQSLCCSRTMKTCYIPKEKRANIIWFESNTQL